MKKIVLSVICIIAFSPSPAHAYRIPEREYWRHFTLSLINESRKIEGLQPIGIDEELNDLAQAHAVDSALHFDDQSYESRRATYIIHTSSDQRTLGDRVREHNISNLRSAGENVGFRYLKPFGDPMEAVHKTITLIHEGMMAEVPPDDGHRRTILGDFTHVGVGLELHRNIDSNENTVFFVTDFGKFSDNRALVIPELGSIPRWNPQNRTTTKTPPITRTIERRMRVRAPITARIHTPETNDPSEEMRDVPSRLPKRPTSWAERNHSRVRERLSERAAVLLEQSALRREERLKRR